MHLRVLPTEGHQFLVGSEFHDASAVDDGDAVGDHDGLPLGEPLGLTLGELDGDDVGLAVGLELGHVLGLNVGDALGRREGLCVGPIVGRRLGLLLGFALGLTLGDHVGLALGARGRQALEQGAQHRPARDDAQLDQEDPAVQTQGAQLDRVLGGAEHIGAERPDVGTLLGRVLVMVGEHALLTHARAEALRGPREGLLELVVCTKNSKEHESIVVMNARPLQVHTALLLLGARPGTPRTRSPL